jgi:hypothetical protein
MDLLTTVRKEGSRGGRGDFKWSDVQASTHRENYLGHSLMAPVGRWQKGRDLNWYAKGDTENKEGETDAERAARERKEEIKRVKEAEQDALARALGFEVAPRNPNLEALGDKKDIDRVLKEAVDEEGAQGGKGVGFGGLSAGSKLQIGDNERIEGNAEVQDAELSKALREYKRRHGEQEEPRRSKSKDRERRHHRHHHRDSNREHRRRSRSREHRSKRNTSRSRSRETRSRGGRDADREAGRGGRDHNRSRSPRKRRDDRGYEHRREDWDKRK